MLPYQDTMQKWAHTVLSILRLPETPWQITVCPSYDLPTFNVLPTVFFLG